MKERSSKYEASKYSIDFHGRTVILTIMISMIYMGGDGIC